MFAPSRWVLRLEIGSFPNSGPPHGMRSPTLNEARCCDGRFSQRFAHGSVEAGLTFYGNEGDEPLWRLMDPQPEHHPDQGRERGVTKAPKESEPQTKHGRSELGCVSSVEFVMSPGVRSLQASARSSRRSRRQRRRSKQRRRERSPKLLRSASRDNTSLPRFRPVGGEDLCMNQRRLDPVRKNGRFLHPGTWWEVLMYLGIVFCYVVP